MTSIPRGMGNAAIERFLKPLSLLDENPQTIPVPKGWLQPLGNRLHLSSSLLDISFHSSTRPN